MVLEVTLVTFMGIMNGGRTQDRRFLACSNILVPDKAAGDTNVYIL